MPARRLLLAAAFVAVGLAVWFLWPRHESESNAELSSAATAAAAAVPRALNASPPAPSLEVSDLARHLNAPAGDIHSDLRIVLDVIEAFRTNFPKEGNPVGTNSEITATLSGGNRFRLALIPPRHSAINPRGELCDRWGTPFFFHAESATRMEVRSAGPDRKMWTDDDVVLAP